MNTHLKLQTEFQQLTGQTIKDKIYIPTVEERKSRLQLALEELTELADAFGLEETFYDLMQDKQDEIVKAYKLNNSQFVDSEIYNQTEVLDALLDIEIINNGTIITCGLQKVFDINYEIVDANNKTKFHHEYLEALKTQKFYTDKNIKTEIKEVHIEHLSFYVVKNEYGKVLKPYNYTKVKLEI